MPKLRKNTRNMSQVKNTKTKVKHTAKLKTQTPDYDSMIENGTSEEDTDHENVNGQQSSANEASTSDDGFSEHEEPIEESKSNKRKQKDKMSTITNSNVPKKQKKTPNATEEAPTLTEINELKETRNLYHSNLFRLQIKEMLTEVKLKEKYMSYTNKWLTTFQTYVLTLESEAEKTLNTELTWLRTGDVQVPLSLHGIETATQKPFYFQFIKPTVAPMLVGAAAIQSLLGPRVVLDVCVLMPAACFQKDNYLNLVYDQKRAYYLIYLLHKLRASKEFPELTYNFSYHNNNPLKPVLQLTPATNTKLNKLCIQIHVAAEEQSFKLSRFVPWNSNIRATLYGDELDETASPLATPYYNANVLQDLTLQRNQKFLAETFDNRKNFQEGLLLLKVWLRQRELHVGYCGFGAHIMAMYIVYLFKQHKLNAHMSSYQVARNVWHQLAISTWSTPAQGITLATIPIANSSLPTLAQFHEHYEVVFVDVTGYHNICAQLPLEMYERVRQEAKVAVDMLNDMKLNSFQYLFMNKLPLYTQFDHLLKINKPDAIEQLLELHTTPALKYDTANYAYPQLLHIVRRLLRKGLHKRVKSLMPLENINATWAIDAHAPVIGRHLHLGIILNPEYAYEVLERGPKSIAIEAEEFRKFWGEKAQLRRFHDGSIVESVVWGKSTDTQAKKRLIVREIATHLLQHHFQLDTSDFEYIGGDFDLLYKLTPAFKTESINKFFKVPQDTDAESCALLVIRAFDELARQLHKLGDLPVEIVGITGTSSIFKYCEPEPVLPEARVIDEQFFAKHVHRAVMQLGLSGNWPNELTALRALKTAFYIQIAQLLRNKYKLLAKVTYDGVLVLKNGYCFLIELAHPKEIALLKKEKQGIVTQYVHCAASIALERQYYVAPKVTNALHALYQAQPCFGTTVMIAKRWLGAQLIDAGLWPDEVTELLIAQQFLKAQPVQHTHVPQTGFIRFLQLLGQTDWQSELFLVNFNSAMEETEIADLEKRFRSERASFPPLTIATAYDLTHYGQLWTTQEQPNVNVLARVTLLARQAIEILEPALLATYTKDGFIKPARLFTASHHGYDLVIQLKSDQVPNVHCYDLGSPFAALSRPNWRLPLAGTNYLRDVVQQLREAYSDYAAFFYNPYGGKEIGVVWKPDQVFQPKSFKVNEVQGCTLSTTVTDQVQCLKTTLIEDFKFICKDFYQRIDTVEVVLRESRASTKRYYAQAAVAAPKQTKKLKEPPTKQKKTQAKTPSDKEFQQKKSTPNVKRKKHKK